MRDGKGYPHEASEPTGERMLNLDMRQLEYFVTAASAGSYASAAKKLFVSPQAISKGVQVLERNMGVALFERGPNGIALTSFGETFYRESKTVLESLERLQSMADRYQREHAASLSVGIHSLCFKEHGGSIDWNDLLEFHDAHKNIDPSFVEMRGDSIVDLVDGDALDFGISVLLDKDFEVFEGILLKKFPLAAIVSAGEDYLKACETVSLNELVRGQLVLFSEEDAFNNFFVEQVEREGSSVEVSPLQIRTDSDIDFVINRRLYTVRPYQHATRTTKGDSVKILPIRNAEESYIQMPLYLFWKKGRRLSDSEGAFVEMVVGFYRAAKDVCPKAPQC